jgi:hypothetical protein
MTRLPVEFVGRIYAALRLRACERERHRARGQVLECAIIDESMFGTAATPEGAAQYWMFGFCGPTAGSPVFMCHVTDRTGDTLLPLIQEYAAPGAEVSSDGWKCYAALTGLGFKHHVVNHSESYVATDGTCTNRIEGIWGASKEWMLRHDYWNGLHREEYLQEWCCRYNLGRIDGHCAPLELCHRLLDE